MMLVELFRERVLGIPPRNIPAMDGAWRPNDLLESCAALPLTISEPTGLAWAPDTDTLYIASGQDIHAARGPNYETAQIRASMGGSVRALTWHPKFGLVAAVSGRGVATRAETDAPVILVETDREPLTRPTGVAVAPDSAIYVTEGSSQVFGEDWVRDLMAKGSTGRLVRFAENNRGQTLAAGLAFPAGVAADSAGRPHVCEAWRHRIVRITEGKPEVVVDNLPGYPGSLLHDGGEWWLSLFAPRSHIVEFVLEETEFRRKMMQHIAPEFWIAPSTSSREHHFHPVQVGALRSQNIKKPWAPPRSYGLLAHLDGDFVASRSLHSRSNGKRHGVGAVVKVADRLFAAAQGADVVLEPLKPGAGH